MKRKEFIKKVGLATAGLVTFPTILPSSRIFTNTRPAMANHVVLIMFAGGVRHQEAALQGYLQFGQGLKIPTLNSPDNAGNIMPNIFIGPPPDPNKTPIVYGNGQSGANPIPPVFSQSNNIEAKGLTFKEVGCITAGHYQGYNALLQGNFSPSQGLKQKPAYPTIFEYVRKFRGEPASKVWLVGNTIGGSIPLLNYSDYFGFGSKYGANFIVPSVTFGQPGKDWFENAQNFHPENELKPMYKLKDFLDNNFSNVGVSVPDIGNTADEKYQIHEFIKLMFNKTNTNSVAMPPGANNNDARTIGYTAELLKYFKPTLTAVILSDVDQCHVNYTGYLRALHRADHSVGWLWNYIQTQIPEMAGDTVMLITPECGRDLYPNPIHDGNNYFAYDHSDANSLRTFASLIGTNVPQGIVKGGPGQKIGMNINVVPTIAEILGIKNAVVNAGFLYNGTYGQCKSFFELL